MARSYIARSWARSGSQGERGTSAAAQVEAALESVSAETREGAAAATHYSGAIEASAAKARAAAVAVQGAGVQMRQEGAASALSAGRVANVTAQFNDIGMILMAGQNPLQLAIQEGTQITQ
ncbi:hypothetical protein SAMN05444722_1005 [Rhodovulum sp. ES.010]|uniref:hypothetical protein n=1 Tax=Rhodovulum sp. ES.010 TaxID=1882821 RepID=UPI0009291D34|nr:hypothetical protein [Rhodovulum sp. ES.010]SIO24682.1 hypothetical protein SAMN05444722_1005 [Rhodovulum sp. ES.010]